MKVHELDHAPSAALAASLEQFESSFSYPLGDESRFRIDHGEDYTRFFRAMGASRTIVVTDDRDKRVLGTLSLVRRELRLPGGKTVPAAYLCDLKVDSRSRRGWVLLKILRRAWAWVRTRRPRPLVGYGVVMRGTERTPDGYSGRLGLPAFRRVGEIRVLRLTTGEDAGEDSHEGVRSRVERVPGASVEGLFLEISAMAGASTFVPVGGSPGLRSGMSPEGLRTLDGLACGLLEDTRRAKRLVGDGNAEILSAHLSHFAFRGERAARALLDAARRRAGELGFDSLFVSVPPGDARSLIRDMDGVVEAPADIYAAGVDVDQSWSIHTAEI